MLREIDSALLSEISDVPCTSCYVTRLYRLSDERNAWQWSKSRTHPGSEAYAEDFAAAAKRVEGRRVQGSRWWIREVACFVALGDKTRLVVAPAVALTPFEGCRRLEFSSPSLGGIASVFLSSRHRAYVFLTDALPAPAPFPLRTWRSRVARATRRLAWDERTEQRGYQHLADLFGRLLTVIQDA